MALSLTKTTCLETVSGQGSRELGREDSDGLRGLILPARDNGLWGHDSVEQLRDLASVDVCPVVALLAGLEGEHDLLLGGHLALA